MASGTGPPWTTWNWRRNAASPSPAPPPRSPGAMPDQPDRHARPRRFHRRGRAEPPRPGRGDPGALRRGRRAGPIADHRPADAPLSRAPAGLHQQDGPHRRRRRQGGRAIADEAGLRRRADADCPSAARPTSRAWSTWSPQKAHLLRRPQRRRRPPRAHPRRAGRRGPRARGSTCSKRCRCSAMRSWSCSWPRKRCRWR